MNRLAEFLTMRDAMLAIISGTAALILTTMGQLTELFAGLMYNDMRFAGVVLALVILDTITGMRAAVKQQRNLNSRAFGGLGDKLLIYGVLLIVGHICGTLVIGGDEIHYARYFQHLIGMFMVLREVWSIQENAKAIGIKFPAWLIRPLARLWKKGPAAADDADTE